ncbi:hypothetical protein Pcinc_026450 [Petrolisthes cinctipes]|uniref:CHK kinase-like domain-containing protein n=1 Tax=Petrolisthes cinctipes TaxID=88211 RepID=A0AAE1F8C3_PETCI|nr:hypothetical protein Pcinc_026450 [Petrolisthes cinctipes]
MEDWCVLPLVAMEDITQQWLRKVLIFALNSDITLMSWNVRKQEGKVGVAGEICFIEVTFTTRTPLKEQEQKEWKIEQEVELDQKQELEYSKFLVVKLFPKDKNKIKTMKKEKFGEREVEFYKYASTQEFKRFCQESGIVQPVPRMYWAGMSENALTIVLYDLTSDNYTTLVPPEGISLGEVKVILESVAIIHASGFAKITSSSRDFFDIPWDGGFQSEQVLSGLNMQIPMFALATTVDTLKALKSLVPELLHLVYRFPFMETLIHGDLWTGNVMFSQDVRSVSIIDWQFMHLGNPVCDLLTLLLMSSNPIVYQEHLTEVLECYWLSFEEALIKNGVRSKLNVSLHDLFENVEAMWMYGFMFFSAAFSHLMSYQMMSENRAKAVVSFLEKRGVFEKFLASKH